MLSRYAAAIVGDRSEDVTQDAFSKALIALRRDDAEVELRAWLYRIVRNTALNDLRDRPAAAAELAETIATGSTPAEALEQREELMERLRALPETQRAAIVMRELEGFSHNEIAAALGLSGGGARQAIHRARQALRYGAGMLVPLPLLRALIGPEGSAAAEAAGGAVGVAGAGLAVKATAATVLVAGTVGAGVALQETKDANGCDETARAAMDRPGSDTTSAPAAPLETPFEDSSGPGSDSGPGGGDEDVGDDDRSGPSRRDSSGGGHDGSVEDDHDNSGGSDSSGSGDDTRDEFADGDSSGSGGSGSSSGSGSGGSSGSGSGSGSDDFDYDGN